ncbi:MAG: PKD domain-containing protein [Candidatus Melainabacteria bacterium]|nr:PKD domain-containing protein [Candidatus Melainabacteria bacterium]
MSPMIWRSINLSIAVTLLFCHWQACAQPMAKSKQPELNVSPLKGKAPLTVVLSGPQELVSRMQRGRNGGFDTSYSFTWGTGQGNLDPRIPQALSHTYYKPGTYYIGATLLKPGPSDDMMGSYVGSATVVVEGFGSSTKQKPQYSDPFYRCLQMSPKYVRLKKNDKAGSKTATLLLTQKVPPNFEYYIDWGDGCVEQQEAPPRNKNSAHQFSQSTKTISHTYKLKGKYRVRLKTNNDEPSRKARDITYYECFDISI